MEIHLPYYVKNAMSYLKSDQFLPSLTIQQKQILAIGLAALGGLGLTYLIYRCFRKSVKKIELDKATISTPVQEKGDKAKTKEVSSSPEQKRSEKVSTPKVVKEQAPSSPHEGKKNEDAPLPEQNLTEKNDSSSTTLKEEVSSSLQEEEKNEDVPPSMQNLSEKNDSPFTTLKEEVLSSLKEEEKNEDAPPSEQNLSEKNDSSSTTLNEEAPSSLQEEKKNEEAPPSEQNLAEKNDSPSTTLEEEAPLSLPAEKKDEEAPSSEQNLSQKTAEKKGSEDDVLVEDSSSSTEDEVLVEDSSSSHEDEEVLQEESDKSSEQDESDVLFLNDAFNESTIVLTDEGSQAEDLDKNPNPNESNPDSSTLTETSQPAEVLPAQQDPAAEPGIMGRLADGTGQLMQAAGKAAQAAGQLAKNTGQAVVDGTVAVGQGALGVAQTGAGYVKTGFNAAVDARAMAIEYRQQLREGIDLWPYLVEGFLMGRKGAQLGATAFQEFMNAPSSEFDPVTANVMQGFAGELGPRLHYLLLNGCALLGPQYAGQLAHSFNLTGKIGKIIGNKIVNLSNPLGWGALILELSDLGLVTRDFFQGGVIALLEEKIHSQVRTLAERSGMDLYDFDYLLKDELQDRAEKNYSKETEKFIAQLNANGISAPVEAWYAKLNPFSDYWYVKYEESHASLSYKLAKQTLAKREQEFEEFKKSDSSQSHDIPRQGAVVKFKVYLDLIDILSNTSKKTLAHFVKDINGIAESNPKIPLDMKLKMQEAFSTFILGCEDPTEDGIHIENAKQATHGIAQIAKAVTKIAKDPVGTAAAFIPEDLADQAKDAVAPVNNMLGKAVGDVAIGALFNEEKIEMLGLKNLNLFDETTEKQLNFDINKSIQDFQGLSQEQKEKLLSILSYSPVDIDKQMQQLMQKAGKSAARMLANAIAARLEELLRQKKLDYSAKDLMEKQVSLPFLHRVGKGLNVGVQKVKAVAGVFAAISEASNNFLEVINEEL